MRHCSLDVGFVFLEDSLGTVKRSIESLQDNYNMVWAIDGRFRMFEGRELSTDTVRDYLKSKRDIQLIDAPNLYENKKRQIVLDHCESPWLLWLDSDDYIFDTDWDAVFCELESWPNDTPEIISMKFYRGPKLWGGFPKVWHHPEAYEFTDTHCYFRNIRNNRVQRRATNSIDSLRGQTDNSLRNIPHDKLINEYQGRLITHEKPLRDKYR